MTVARSHNAVPRRPVHIGAACYAAGPLVPLEEAISDEAMRARLRNPNHGSDTFPSGTTTSPIWRNLPSLSA